MADGGTGEKTEEPTPERLRKLRKYGNVPKSQDITTALSFIVTFTVLAGSLGFIAEEFSDLVNVALLAAQSTEPPGMLVQRLLNQSMITLARTCAPVMGAAFLIGMVMNISQVGFMFTLKPITPDIKKINPMFK